MTTTKPKVVVAMSGGVDSSVAACLLHEQGYDVVGLFMRVGAGESSTTADASPVTDNETSLPVRNRQGCCSATDAADARFVAGMLDIPFYVLNFKEDFEELIDYFADEYVNGRTPNPCIVCNRKLKFGKLAAYAEAAGIHHIATGHYARVDHGGRSANRTNDCTPVRINGNGSPVDQPVLRRAIDDRKDQSYVLFDLERAVLERTLFPVGGLTKDEVRSEARRFGLPVCDKPDSVEICFVPDRDYARVVRERRPEAFRDGDVVGQDGEALGRHAGIGHFTVGQRRGLGIAAGVPIYVTQLDVATNTVTVGEKMNLLKREVSVGRVNLLLPEVPRTFRADVKIRYLHSAAPATVELDDSARNGTGLGAHIVFDEPQTALTPGQAAVFYDGDVVIGGGWIAGGLEQRAHATPNSPGSKSPKEL